MEKKGSGSLAELLTARRTQTTTRYVVTAVLSTAHHLPTTHVTAVKELFRRIGLKYLQPRHIYIKKKQPFFCKAHPFMAGKGALTASSDRICGSVSTATRRWKFQWCWGWGRGWGGVPPRSPGRRAPLPGRRARLSGTSCPLWPPPSGSASPPQRWCGRAGGCGLGDKVSVSFTAGNGQNKLSQLQQVGIIGSKDGICHYVAHKCAFLLPMRQVNSVAVKLLSFLPTTKYVQSFH